MLESKDRVGVEGSNTGGHKSVSLFEQLMFTKPGKHAQEEPSWAQGRGNLQT